MRTIFSAVFLLLYLLVAFFIAALVINNTHDVTLNTLILGEVVLPLYLPLAVAFGLGLLIGLIYHCVRCVKRRLSSSR